jgi:hypothetical protein
MLLVGTIIKRAMKGELDIISPAMAVAKELTSVPSFESVDTSVLFAEEKIAIKNMKKAILMVAGKAVQALAEKLNEEQEVMMHIADMIIETYALESTVLRTEKLVSVRGEKACEAQINMSKLYAYEAVSKTEAAGKEAILAFTSGDEQRVMLMGLKRYTKLAPINTKELRRAVADMMIEEGKYCF